jgi:hypothetical protein
MHATAVPFAQPADSRRPSLKGQRGIGEDIGVNERSGGIDRTDYPVESQTVNGSIHYSPVHY